MSSYDDDAPEIADRLTARIESVLDALNPGWVQHRGKAYLTAKGPKQLGSFGVNLQGPKRGNWYRFSQQVGGGPIHLVAYLLTGNAQPSKDDWSRAFEWARDFLGMPRRSRDGGETEEQRKERLSRQEREKDERERRQRLEQAAENRRKAMRQETAAGIWDETVPIAGTLAEDYLVKRGIPPVREWKWEPSAVLRFHHSLAYGMDQSLGPFPALVCRVDDAFDALTSVWRIYLDPATAGKAPVEIPGTDNSAKVGLGSPNGGAIRIGGIGPDIDIAEGVESALAGWVLHGMRRPFWSVMSTSGMVGFEPPIAVEKVRITPDGDLGRMDPQGRVMIPPGLRAARRAAERFKTMGIAVVVNDPPIHGDLNDALLAWKRRGLTHAET